MKLTRKEEAAILRRRHAAKLRAARGKRVVQPKDFAKPPEAEDKDYLAWLHHGLPCIGCMILGPAPKEHAYIEAAHQKAQDADRGWHKKLGKRPPHRQCAPLCAWHHRLGPNCCDPAQRKFWDLLGVDVIAFCQALYAAFKAGESGAPIIRQFARKEAA